MLKIRSVRALFALAAAMSLGFGATTAFAGPSALPYCFGGAIVGTCTSQQNCQTKCVQAGGYAGECDSRGCCHCAI